MEKKLKISFFTYFFALITGAQSINNYQIDSLQNILNTVKEDTIKIAVLNQLSWCSLLNNNFINGVQYAEQALKLAEKTEDKHRIAVALRKLGNVYDYQAYYEKAIEYYLKSLKLAQETGDIINIAHCYNNLGNEYASIGAIADSKADYEKALEFHFQAIKLFRKVGAYNSLNNSLLNISVVYRGLGEHEKSLDFYFQALEGYIKEKDANGIEIARINIGETYMELAKKKDDAEYYEKAEEQFSEVFRIYPKTDISQRQANLLVNMGEIRFMQSNTNDAIKYLSNGLAIAKTIKAYEILKNGSRLLAETYKIKGDYKQAYEYLELSSGIKDTLLNEKSRKQIAELNARYESEERNKENKILAQKNEIQKYELNRKNYFIYGLSGSTLFVVLFAFILIRHNRLQTMQKTSELEQKLLRAQMNPHFIFNSLNSIQSYIYKNDPQNAGSFLSKFAGLIRMILDNSRHEMVSLEKELKGLNLYLDLQALRFDNKFDYSIEVDPEINSESIAIPPMLAQPFIENAIEHGLLQKKEGGKIIIRFLMKNNYLLFEVEDNGIGREEAAKLKNFQEKKHVSLATVITKERLTLLNKRHRKKIELNITDLKSSDNVTQGTKVIFTIPFVEI